MDPIESTVKAFLLEQFLPGAAASELTSDLPLMSSGILDSLATVRLVAFLEEQYGIEVAPHEASVEFLDTLGQIRDFVRSKVAHA